MITIDEHVGQFITLKVSGENFHADVDFIKKNLIGRRYNPDKKVWQIPILKANFSILEKAKKHFKDHDALWAFEPEDFATFLKAELKGDAVKLTSFYDENLVEIIKRKKTKEDKWDGEKWTLKKETWDAIKEYITKYLDSKAEKYSV